MRFDTLKIQMIILSEEQLISQLNWERDFENKNVDKKVLIFNKTALNSQSNIISHESIICDDKETPWFNTNRKIIHKRVKTYKVLSKNIENIYQIEKLKSQQNRLKCVIMTQNTTSTQALRVGYVISKGIQNCDGPYERPF